MESRSQGKSTTATKCYRRTIPSDFLQETVPQHQLRNIGGNVQTLPGSGVENYAN